MARNTNTKVASGLAAAAAGLAAGYYFYASEDAAKHRKIAAKWAGKLKSDVVKQTKKLKEVDKKTVAQVIDSAAKAYAGARNLNSKEVTQAALELKKNWEKVMREAKGSAKKASAKTVKKVKKTVARAASKRNAKKRAK